MMLLLSALAFFLLITSLILIHEFGHFIMARKAGVEVEEFGFGLPPRARGFFTWKGTLFSLNWIPFGGFVRLKGENAATPEERTAPGSFASVSIPKRSAILLAGVTMNFLLAILIFLYGFSVGGWVPTYLSLDAMEAAAARGDIHLTMAVLVDDVLEGGGAAEAGIPSGSVITAVDGQPVDDPVDILALQEGRSSVTYSYHPQDDPTREQTAQVAVQEGKTGVFLRSLPLTVSGPLRNPLDAAALAFRETAVVTKQTVLGIAQLFTSLAQHGQVPEGITGIVGIAQLTHSSVQEGFSVYLRLMALLSLSLAILNILPFPALDGGRLVFVLSELFIRPGSRRVELITNSIGFAFLLVLILLVTLYDILRLFD